MSCSLGRVPRLMSVAATDSRIQNLQRRELRKAFVVNRFNRCNEMFEVRKMQDGTIYTVNLAQRHCDCSHFQVEQLPYRHVLACCANQRLDWQVYVHDVYKMSEIFKVYKCEFVPMGDPSTYDRYEGAKVIANWTLRRATKGRLKSTRYLNEMDSREMRGLRRCTICGRASGIPISPI
ncbi:uncharacterized protein LOC107477297 [Arachis duranensis]|uniref:Uncharacterized protein LOC107477297 n=1 Tax=Arachis duranensis TaxID=130453 RepID=A0A6P4CLE2_ARADU|nr:uncharacterized protein LOC107477297 [Arachis duranensis]